MGQWNDVNSLQNQNNKAESEFKALCEKCASTKEEISKKKKEIKDLYDKQDATISTILGPRTLYADEKIIAA